MFYVLQCKGNLNLLLLKCLVDVQSIPKMQLALPVSLQFCIYSIRSTIVQNALAVWVVLDICSNYQDGDLW